MSRPAEWSELVEGARVLWRGREGTIVNGPDYEPDSDGRASAVWDVELDHDSGNRIHWGHLWQFSIEENEPLP